MPDMLTLWTDIKALFEENNSKTAYATWIETAKPIALDGNKLTLELPSPLHRDYWTHQHLDQQLVEYAYQAAHEDIQPVLILENERQQQATLKAKTAPVAAGEPVEPTPTFMKETALNSRYTFDTFVIGKGNQMAHAAALVVSEEPGVMYNPLFFYGGVGLGKTHLMHAIGNKMLEDRPDTKVKYVTSEAFTNDFINAIQTRTQEQFRQEYRNVDLLLVDDIQFFLETRIAILRNKADADQIDIPDDTLSYIAGQIDSNVRELEGALARVQAYSQLMHQPIATDLAAEALKSLNLANASDAVTIPVIQDRVAKYFDVSLKDLKGKKRKKAIVMPRQIAMYLSRELTEASLPRIGNEFGGKDHTTVIHAYDKITESLKTDPQLQKDIDSLKDDLRR
ncbi:chromosomal replication initiator protein DnaA [Levilactobacillus brevis]|nr:chromosomal replication initiator protein DnaA [Levilactobacillus brevis]